MFLDVDSSFSRIQYRYLSSYSTYLQSHVIQGMVIGYTGMTGMIEEPSFSMGIFDTVATNEYYIIYIGINEDAL